MNYDDVVDLFNLKKLFIENLDEAIRYEQYLHWTGKFKDYTTKVYDDDKERSVDHLINMINGGMKQEMWFEERYKFLGIEPIQPLGIIDPNLTSKEKDEPDFKKIDTKETIEFKWCDTDKYIEDDNVLYVRNKAGAYIPAIKKDLHKADRAIIITVDEDNKLWENQFIWNGKYYERLFERFELKHHLLDMYNKYKVCKNISNT